MPAFYSLEISFNWSRNGLAGALYVDAPGGLFINAPGGIFSEALSAMVQAEIKKKFAGGCTGISNL